ncbi:hypothetical protein [Calidifontibacillus oryziterrae]|uniref:hypothetical protein n=1 Tax=Calidifontibacillus oryziterrae TaxID=1191699 RepID=UPI00030AA8A5|nr:hypothetical protein [Calidifontibacillus oryziterrae]
MNHLTKFLFTTFFLLLIVGCQQQAATEQQPTSPQPEQQAELVLSKLQFVANGEDFIRKGFTSVDGWTITFDHAYITLGNIAAHQTNPPYDPTKDSEIQSVETVSLNVIHTIDLALGDEDEPPILVGEIDAPIGHYNALSWDMLKGPEGDLAGQAIVLEGTATKAEQTIDFVISIDKEYHYDAGEFIGDVRKGFVEEGKTGELEMTFHFDHFFGDFDTPQDDALNTGAIGFEPFAKLAENGEIQITLAEMKEKFDSETYEKLIQLLPSLGHVGEGHAKAQEI